MITQEYVYAYAAVSVADGELDTLILPQVNSNCMQIFLDEVASRHPNDMIILVLDGAGWHRSHTLKLPHNLRLLMLPPYSPELNPVENLWDELRENHSIIVYSTAWTHLKITWKRHCITWKRIVIVSNPSLHGPGL